MLTVGAVPKIGSKVFTFHFEKEEICLAKVYSRPKPIQVVVRFIKAITPERCFV
jgi:hypothetical protein